MNKTGPSQEKMRSASYIVRLTHTTVRGKVLVLASNMSFTNGVTFSWPSNLPDPYFPHLQVDSNTIIRNLKALGAEINIQGVLVN